MRVISPLFGTASAGCPSLNVRKSEGGIRLLPDSWAPASQGLRGREWIRRIRRPDK